MLHYPFTAIDFKPSEKPMRKRFYLLSTVLLTVPQLFPSACGAEETFPLKSWHIQQERQYANGVLVSRPHPTDKRVFDFMHTNRIYSLKDYVRWLKINTRYFKDTDGDQWATPEETLKNKTADCEDYAFLSKAVTQMFGYKPHFVAAVRANGRAHAICVFKHGDAFYWFDNTTLHQTPARSITEFGEYITVHFNYTAMLELNVDSRKWNLIYQRTG